MAFARSASGPASLSINTTSANSLFGSSTATAAQPPASTTNMFSGFGNSNASNTSGTQQSALFGTSKPATPSLFGNTTSQPANSFGSLGQTQSDQNKSNTVPNVFGTLGNVQQQQNTQQNNNSLFNTQPNSLFGNLNQNKPPEKNLFSGLGQTDQQRHQQQKQEQPQPFGASTFGGLSFGQSTTMNPQAPSVPGVKINIDNLRPTTRFNDLHEDLQKLIERVDNGIQNQMQYKHDCDAIMPKHEEQLRNIPNDVDFLTRKCNDVENALASDAEGIFQAKKLVQKDIDGAKLSFSAIDNLKLPHQYQQLGPWSGASSSSTNAALSSSLPNFFIKEADDMLSTLEVYEKNMAEIEVHLRDVEARAVHQFMQSQSRAQLDDPNEPMRELAATFRDFEHGILNVAGKVVGLRDEVDQIKRGGLLGAVAGSEGAANGRSTRRGGVY